MIVTLSSSAADYGETKNSLEYASIASQVVTAKEVQLPRKADSTIDISQLQALIKEREQQLRLALATEMETNLKEQAEFHKQQLDETKAEIESFVTKKFTRKYETERIHFEKEIVLLKKEIASCNQKMQILIQDNEKLKAENDSQNNHVLTLSKNVSFDFFFKKKKTKKKERKNGNWKLLRIDKIKTNKYIDYNVGRRKRIN